MLYKSKARVSNAYSPKNGHYGIDIVGQGDKKIYSPVDGVIIACGNTDPNGWGINVQIKLSSNPKYRMVIGHFNKIGVKNGQIITKGDYLGDEGWTGYTIPRGSGGQHSHTEVRLIGGDRTTAVSPLPYLGLTDGDNKVGTIIDFTKVNQTETATTEKKVEKTLVKQAQHTITATKTVDEDKLLAETTKLKTLGYSVSSKEVSAAIYEIKTTPKTDFKVGDKVTVKVGSKSVSGVGLASFLSDKKEARTIMSINGGNATIGKDGIVTATTSVDNLNKV